MLCYYMFTINISAIISAIFRCASVSIKKTHVQHYSIFFGCINVTNKKKIGMRGMKVGKSSDGIYVTVQFNDRISSEILNQCKERLQSSGLQIIPNNVERTNSISGWLEDPSVLRFSQALLSSDLQDFVKTLDIRRKL